MCIIKTYRHMHNIEMTQAKKFIGNSGDSRDIKRLVLATGQGYNTARLMLISAFHGDWSTEERVDH